MIHNEKIREFLRANKEAFIFVVDIEKRNLTLNEFYGDKITEKFNNITLERSNLVLVRKVF